MIYSLQSVAQLSWFTHCTLRMVTTLNEWFIVGLCCASIYLYVPSRCIWPVTLRPGSPANLEWQPIVPCRMGPIHSLASMWLLVVLIVVVFVVVVVAIECFLWLYFLGLYVCDAQCSNGIIILNCATEWLVTVGHWIELPFIYRGFASYLNHFGLIVTANSGRLHSL